MSNFICETNKKDDELTIYLKGNMGGNDSEKLDAVARKELDGIMHVIIDCSALEHLPSTALQSIMEILNILDDFNDSSLKIVNMNENVREVLRVSGFLDFL